MNPLSADFSHREAARSIWVFTPSRTAPEDLEAIFVQRHELLKDAVERVRESALTDHKHHLLFVGPRGCGKTHLVTLIVSRISADAEAAAALRLAWLNEDETCTSLLELLLKIHSALEKRYPAEFRADALAEAYELKPAVALDFVAKRLLSGLGSKTLVIVTENLDALFDSMGQQGQKQLRAFIQEHPQVAIVGTAQRLVEDLSDRASPFFGFFQTEHLKTLTVEQATDLLQNIARHQGKPEVIAFLATSRGRSRVRALHHLSGGNHRIYIVLSQFITRESMDSLLVPFMKMVDELTPYYQERVRWLPPLQRKIVEMLCTCEGTVPVKEIARRLFSTPQTISSQLQDLREKGYVESSHRGRESLYEISEPLMRLCVEVKENQNNQPLRLLVDFLRVWYDDGELKRRLGLALPESVAKPYDSAAVITELTRVIELPDAPPEPVARALVNRGFTHGQQGDSAAAIADCSRVLELPGAPSNKVIDAHLALAELHLSEGRWSEGFAAMEASLSLGAQASSPRLAAPVDIVGVFFTAGLSQDGRRAQAGTLCTLYAKHAAQALLGEALVKHLGAVFRKGAPWPSADNLDQWLAAWQQAAGDAPEFKLPLRILRVGIDFVKSGGRDEGILLDLTSTERSLLTQALGLPQ